MPSVHFSIYELLWIPIPVQLSVCLRKLNNKSEIWHTKTCLNFWRNKLWNFSPDLISNVVDTFVKENKELFFGSLMLVSGFLILLCLWWRHSWFFWQRRILCVSCILFYLVSRGKSSVIIQKVFQKRIWIKRALLQKQANK